jgi:hypothetical protein
VGSNVTVTATATKAVIGYTPFHKQSIAHSCPAEDMFYGGAAGGGKSDYIVHDPIYHCLQNPGAEALLLRREWKEIRRLIRRSRDILDKTGQATYHAGERQWSFNNGSIFTFGHAQHEDDIEKYTGDEYSWIGLDEGPTFTPYQTEYISSRNRSSKGIWPRQRKTGNPKGVSFWDFKMRYVEPPDRDVELVAWFDEDAALADNAASRDYGTYWRWYAPGTRGNPAELIDRGRGIILVWRPHPTPALEKRNKLRAERGDKQLEMPTICWIPSYVQDNPYLYEDGNYERGLAASLGEDLADALLEGNWDRFEGQAFPEFKIERHVVPPISIPEHWATRVWGGMDWGWAKPGCHLWAVQNPENQQIIVYREIYEDHKTDGDWCHDIKERTLFPERLRFTLADPSMWKTDSSDEGLSKAAIYRRNGVILEPGNNDRVPGWSQVHNRLALDPVTGVPGLVVTENCVNLIRTMQAAVVDDTRPEDVDTECEDHALDALRYLLMAKTTNRRAFTKPVAAGRVRR